jgi:YD repeat-containing protein
MNRASTAGVLSRFAVRGPCPLGRGRALAYRSAPHHLEPLACDAAGQRLAHTPLPRATPAVAGLRLFSL